MMKHSISIVFFLLFSFVISGQTIVIDETVKVDSTEVKFKSGYFNHTAYSTIDNKKQDSLIVHIFSIGLVGYSININIDEPISLNFFIYSDVNEFDGKHSMEVELEKYELIINKDKLELGDTLMGTISGETKEFVVGGSKHKICFEGYFHHIIGKVLRKLREGGTYDSYDPRGN